MKKCNYEKIINEVIDREQEKSFREYGYSISWFVVSELSNARFALIDAFREAGCGKWTRRAGIIRTVGFGKEELRRGGRGE